MKQELALRRARWQKVSEVFAASAGISGLADIATMIEAWTPRIDEWDRLQASSAGTGKGGFGNPKQEAKYRAAKLLSRTGRRCSVQAHMLGLYSVEHLLDRRPYELWLLKDADARKEMAAMRNALCEHREDFRVQGLTKEKLTEIDETIKTYVDLFPKVASARDARSAFNAQIRQLTAELDADMTTIIHLLEAEYEDSDPAFVNLMLTAAQLGRSSGHRNTGLQGRVIQKDGKLAAGYNVRCSELNKEAVTDLAGVYHIPRMKIGLHQYELLDPEGNKLDEAVIRMRRGVTVVKDWVI